MNTNGFIGIFAFAVLYLISRAAFSWLKHLSYEAAGQTVRSVEKHYDEVKRKKIPYEKELTWLSRLSSKPVLTKALYISYYFSTSLNLAGIALSAANIFVPALNDLMNKSAMCMLALCIFSALCSIVFYTPFKHLINKSNNKKK